MTSLEMDYAQSLPIEVVERILSCLSSLEDRKAAGFTCTRWYSAFLNPHLRQNYAVKFKNDKDFKMFQLMKPPIVRYFHFEFDEVDITRDSLAFWQEHGKYIKSLTLQRCYVGEKIFTEALSHCINLSSLTVVDCKDLFMSGIFLDSFKTHHRLRCSLGRLQHVDLSYNRYVSDSIVHTILAMCPFVCTLNLTGCQISYHHGMYKKFYPHEGQPPSESVTTFITVMQTVENRGKTSLRLNFSETLLDNSCLLHLASSKRMGIVRLEIRECPQISDQGIIEMCAAHNMNALTHLDIGACERLTDEAIRVVCSTFRSLVKFSMQGCPNVTDAGIENISQLDKLQIFYGGNCQLIQGEGLVKGLAYKTNTTLREIYISQMGNLSEEMFINLVEKLPELRIMDVSGSRNAITDRAVQAIFKHNRLLRSLNISSCDAITDSGITGKGVNDMSPQSEKHLRIPLGSRHELDIRMDAEIREQVKELCEQADELYTGESLSQLQGLQVLNLQGCVRVTDVSLEHSFFLNELQKLDLSGCQQITHIGLRFLAKNCKALENLNLNMCFNVTDEGVNVVVEGLPRLKILVLGNDCITSEVARIVEKSRLTQLDVRYCSKVPAEAVGHLKQTVRSLRVLKYQEVGLRDTELQCDVKPPKPPPCRLWKWCS